MTSLRSSAGGPNWSGRLLDYLQQIRTPYVMMMLDDFFLRDRVLNEEVVSCLNFAHSQNAVQVRLIARPRPTTRLPSQQLIGESAPGSPYRLSTQAAIWNRIQLHSLLKDGESIWDFEHQGNLRALEFSSGFFSVWRPVIPYEGWFSHHVVEKGKWFPHEKLIFSRQSIDCDFSKRATLSWSYDLFYQAVSCVSRILNLLPWEISAWSKRTLKRLFRPFLGRTLIRLSETPSASRSDSQNS